MNPTTQLTRPAIFISLSLALFLVIWKGLREGGDLDDGAGPSRSDLTAGSRLVAASKDRVALERSCRELRSAMEVAYERLTNKRGLSPEEVAEAEVEFLRKMARHAATSLGEVSRFIEALDARNALPPQRRWLGDILQELAKKQPRKALDFGLALNGDNLEFYTVPPRTLLGIALQHLTAEDAIRVMEMPLRDPQQYRIYSEASPGEVYRSDFDFRMLGDYIVSKEHEGQPHSWKPTTHPDDFVKSWTKRDPSGAEAFCRAMNDRPDGAITGMEYMDYFRQLARQESRTVVAEEILKVIADPEVSLSIGYMSANWLQDETSRAILMQAVPHLSAKERDAMGHDALLMNALSDGASAVEICAAAMQLFATDAARQSLIETVHRFSRNSSAVIRQAEEVYLNTP